ncbi:MAG: InlB B-repeat-containing protein, partial [Bacilli bacterium]|nr:InlB B-repeat-containing protein [Bacilli bacterium]
TFKGWYDNADYTKGKQYYNENNVAVRTYDKTSNLTLYAGWSKVVVVQTYQVTFNINGGSGTTPGRVNAVLGSAMPSITSSIPTRSGYIFMGWYDNTDYTKGTQYYTNKNVSARNYDKTSGITLYAGWKSNEIKCTITYNANGGSGAPGAQTYTYATSGTINLSSTVPTRSGFIFLGWATSSSATIAKYSAGQSWNKSNKGNYTLYAVWGSSLKIYYLSLGRYDGFLIMGNGTTLFIDGGDPSPGHKCVEFLQNMGITKIDGLIGSHLHYNHIAAHEEIIDNFNVKAVYYPDDPRTCKERKTCKDSAVKPDGLIPKLNNIQVNVVTPQMNYKIGNLEFDILAPFDLNGSTNDNSLNMILKYGSHKFYFTGDTGTSVLKKIYQTYDSSVYENISIFKHPHHGQNEVPSSLIKVMKPQYVIVPNNTKSLAGSEYKSVKSTVYELNNNKGGYVLAESDGTTLKVTDKRKP